MERNSEWRVKVGFLLVVLVWFIFTAYQLAKALINGVDVPYTDIPGGIGLGFRTAAGVTALIAILYFVVKKDLPRAKVVYTFRLVVLLMVAYFAFFLPSAIWGFQHSSILYSNEFFILETGLPCLLKAIVMPFVLTVFFFKLKEKEPAQNAVRWGLIAAVTSTFVLWFDYTSQWWSEIYLRGTSFIMESRLYAFEFVLTIIGLLFIAVYAGVYAKQHSAAKTLSELNFRKLGIIVSGLGLYFDIIWVLWIMFGDVSGGKLTVWPAFSVLHNVDLWMVALPLAGLPLLLSKRGKRK
jgi:hypothetical protein